MSYEDRKLFEARNTSSTSATMGKFIAEEVSDEIRMDGNVPCTMCNCANFNPQSMNANMCMCLHPESAHKEK